MVNWAERLHCDGCVVSACVSNVPLGWPSSVTLYRPPFSEAMVYSCKADPVKLKERDEPGVVEDIVPVRHDSALLLSELALHASVGKYIMRESDGLTSISEMAGSLDDDDVDVEMELCEEDEDEDLVVDCDDVVELTDCVSIVLEVWLEELELVREEEEVGAEVVEGAASLGSY